MTIKPNWLATLNKKPEVASEGEPEEVVIPLPAYEPPPALKLSRDYDAEVGAGPKQSIADATDGMINKFRTAMKDLKAIPKQSVGRGLRKYQKEATEAIEAELVEPNPEPVAEHTTKLPFSFDAAEFEHQIKGNEFKLNPATGDDQNYLYATTVKLQDFGPFAGAIAKTLHLNNEPLEVISPSEVQEKLFSKDITFTKNFVPPTEALDKEYVEELKASNPKELDAKFNGEFYHEGLAEAVTKTGQEALKGIFDQLPKFPSNNTEAIVKDPDWLEAISGNWIGKIDVIDAVAYDDHIKRVMETNPLHASYLARLKAFTSRHVGIISTPEKAEEHIRVCQLRGEDIGGWEDAAHARVKQVQEQLQREIKKKTNSSFRTRYNHYIIRARDAWKQAIAERAVALEMHNSKVKALHEGYVEAKDMSFEEYVARFEKRD